MEVILILEAGSTHRRGEAESEVWAAAIDMPTNNKLTPALARRQSFAVSPITCSSVTANRIVVIAGLYRSLSHT